MRRRHRRCPVYKDVTCPRTREGLEKAIRDEVEAIRLYDHLIEMAPDQFQKDVIIEIRDDEVRHLNNFQAVYCRFMGCTYDYPEPQVPRPKNYCRGLVDAFNDELEAYEFYKANYFCNRDSFVKKAYLDARLDENEHAQWFNNFIVRHGCFRSFKLEVGETFEEES